MRYSSISQTQDARSELQSTSGVPAGAEGRGIDTSVDQNPVSIGEDLETFMVRSDNLASLPPTAFPLQPVSQSIDTIGTATMQPAAPKHAQAAFDRAFVPVSADLGFTLDAHTAQNLIDLVASTAALGQGDSTHLGVVASPNPAAQNSLTIGGLPVDAMQQMASIPNAAPSTSTAIDTQEVGGREIDKDRNDRDRNARRDIDIECRQVHFRAASPRLAEERFRFGTEEYRGSREQRLASFRGEEWKRDTEDSEDGAQLILR